MEALLQEETLTIPERIAMIAALRNAEAEAKGKKAGKAGVDVNMAPRREMNEVRPDIMFGAFVYYSGTGLTFDEIWFPKKEQNGMYSTRVPNK